MEQHGSPAFGLHLRNRASPGDASRLVLRLYSVAVGTFGASVFLWGPTWLDDLHLEGRPFGRAALLRVLGAVVLAAGYCAAGFSSVDEPGARRRGLAWFTGAHVIVFLALLTQRIAVWGAGPADWALWFVLGCTVVLATAEYQSPAAAVMRMLGVEALSPADRRRSDHERRIREAAGQEERNRLARDLHDSIKQQIFAVQTAAAAAQVRLDGDPGGARDALGQIRVAARDAMTEMEAMLDQLRAVPLSNAGLIAALQKQCEALGLQTGARVDLRLGTLPPDGTLPAGGQQALLRVAQEALANVARHARASSVSVSLDGAGGRVELLVQDDGAGITPEHRDQHHGGAGLANMAARASEIGAALDVSSPPACLPAAGVPSGSAGEPRGTLVRFSVPFDSGDGTRRLAWAALWSILLAGSVVGFRNRLDLAAFPASVAAVGLIWSIVRVRRTGAPPR